MGRGILLACEICDFRAELLEEVPLSYAAGGQPVGTTADSSVAAVGYGSDWLCGDCRRPVRITEATEGAPHCPTCGNELMPFDVAERELADASHSRVWLDFRRESEGLQVVEEALESASVAEAMVANGEMTSGDVLEQLANDIDTYCGHAQVENRTGDLFTTQALDALPGLLRNSPTVSSAIMLLQRRVSVSSMYVQQLEDATKEESQLSGVPCPQCERGQLIHWPVWL